MSDKTKILQCLGKYKLTVESEFVPFSKSRNAGEKMPSLNWKVTLKRGDVKILTTDYSAGCGHAPSYKQSETVYSHDAVILECEKGFQVSENFKLPRKDKPIKPDSMEVIYSLLLDSEVLEYGSFEEWAREFGYDEDSRKHEAVYNACMKIALQFNRLGASVIAELREVFQDY